MITGTLSLFPKFNLNIEMFALLPKDDAVDCLLYFLATAHADRTSPKSTMHLDGSLKLLFVKD
jgi:hypothetical protein